MSYGLKHIDMARTPERRLTEPEQSQLFSEIELVYFVFSSSGNNTNVKLPGQSGFCHAVFQNRQNAASGQPDVYEYFQLPNAFQVYDPHHLVCAGVGEMFPVKWDREMKRMSTIAPHGLLRYGEVQEVIAGGGSSGNGVLTMHNATAEVIVEIYNGSQRNLSIGDEVLLYYNPGEGGLIPGASGPHVPNHQPTYSYSAAATRKGRWEVLFTASGAGGPCLLSVSSGSAGNETDTCSYTYDATDPLTGASLATGILPTTSPHLCNRHGPGECIAAQAGNYFLDADGNFILYSFNEKLLTSACP